MFDQFKRSETKHVLASKIKFDLYLPGNIFVYAMITRLKHLYNFVCKKNIASEGLIYYLKRRQRQ